MTLAKNKKNVGSFLYLRVAVDLVDPEDLSGPTQEEMVDEFEKSPQANIEQYFQVIIRNLENQYGGNPLILVNPHIEDEVGSPDAGFDIVGHLRWTNGRPLQIVEKFGEYPVVFSAYIADGLLVEPIFLDFG